MFRTELNVLPSSWKISIDDPVFLLGSCFAIHIGERLQQYKFEALTNPFGTIFNPHSLFRLIEFSLNEEKIPEWSFLENQGIHRNYFFHSDVSGKTEEELTRSIQEKRAQTFHSIKNAKVILLTFGTAVYYRLKKNNEIVANCHKVPAKEFNKEMLSANEIVEGFVKTYDAIKEINPDVNFILTVSPVRHLKDSLEVNSVSKAILRTASEEIKNSHNDVAYFPSFELMMDDLRDYRFYKEDMLHPNDQAITYIWEKFIGAYFDEKTLKFVEEWSSIIKALHHRPFNPGTEEHKNFLMKTIERIQKLNRPNVQEEIEQLKSQLHA